MNTKDSIFQMGIHFSNEDKAGKGFLLSIDEVELVKNMALSLKSQDDKDFLNKIAVKEFVTLEDREVMSQIFMKAARTIRNDPTLTA